MNGKKIICNRWKVYQNNNETFHEETEPESHHEEAETRMLLQAKHASSSYEILISSPDTDAFVICLSVDLLIDANLFFSLV